MSDRSRQRLRTITTIVVTALVIAPAAALATHGFGDVDDGDFFHAAVDWMKDNRVTVGCNPPDNTRYCPDDFVTRGEMAVFLERLDSEDVFLRPGEGAGSAGGDGVDGGDAETLDGKDSTAFLGANAKAADADKLDGKDSTAFLGTNAKAADANKLDGIDSSGFTTDAELASLDAFMPIAVFTVTNATGGTIDSVDFRAPITGVPTVSGADGVFTIDLPGFTYDRFSDTTVCTALLRGNVIGTRGSGGGDLVVSLYDGTGALTNGASEDDFSCVVYDGS